LFCWQLSDEDTAHKSMEASKQETSAGADVDQEIKLEESKGKVV